MKLACELSVGRMLRKLRTATLKSMYFDFYQVSASDSMGQIADKLSKEQIAVELGEQLHYETASSSSSSDEEDEEEDE